MIVNVKESTVVCPAQDTPKGMSLLISNLGQAARRTHGPRVYFYKANSSHNFFEAAILKDALSKVLVPFYPLAGRLKKDHESGKIVIDCNDKGVLFVEAETDSFIDDLGDFVPSSSSDFRQLAPTVDYTSDISSFPLVVLQVTRFKCGGVSLGVGIQHSVADGSSGFRFINAWSDMARGINPATQHFIDQTNLRGRDPPMPAFQHIEFQPPPTLKDTANSQSVPNTITTTTTSAAIFNFSRDQLHTLKAKAKEGIADTTTYYSTFEVLAGHTWRSACRARGLPDDQETKMYISTNGRSRLSRPPIPPDYFGNAVFSATPIAVSGNLQSEQLEYAVGRIHETMVRMDEEYLRSALDFLELHLNQVALMHGTHFFRCPNIRIISWARMPTCDADFGWGRPIFVGPTEMTLDGMAYILPSCMNDGSLSLLIALEHDHMQLFKKFIHDI
ncbi:shikimate O-hydroxycinnamoyltransferase-like [Macadamia integrifolia]|uniref:shikimate O-hydroxycinnamoyltransferase-like n=1 Tax=Macadamia integrifolia TaxID=60698 RepID=UPI001C4EE447|nr:shikimate O-hydroxycinnamoyltransferase-like [Macadamia integrifolia]